MDLKAILAGVLKSSPTAFALVAVFWLGLGHIERMDSGHRAAIKELADSLKFVHEEFNRRNSIADRAVTQIERLTMLVDKLNDRIIAGSPVGRP